MRRPVLIALITALASVVSACGSGATSEGARHPARSSSTSPPSTVASSTTTTAAPPTTTAPPETTTSAPVTTAPPSADPPPEPAPAWGGNGQLSDASLTTVTPSCRILNDLAPRLQNLLAAAHAAGIALWPETKPYTTDGATPPRLTSCYRDLEMQQWWRDHYCGLGSCGMAAVPGTSVHGWGRAVDFEEGGEELAFASNGYAWLTAHAGDFGFFQPAWAGPSGGAPEPWHWEAA